MGIVLDLAAKGSLQKVLDTVSSVLSKRIRVRISVTTLCEAQKPERNLVFVGLCELGDDAVYPAPKAEDDEDCCSFSSPTVTDPSVSVRQTTVPVKMLDYGSINTTPSKNKNRD